jgi:cellulose synthase/poly-beta-1,6-N-acetylglucosamine synthase-like glycosyltransferase
MREKRLSSKEKILVSVVVPAYNEEKLIASCLMALKNQNFPQQNYEIIMVNNASTDKTGEIAQKLNVRVIFQPKKGVVFALKKGFSQARGEIISFTDADTMVNKDWLKNIYRAFQKDPGLVFVGGRTIFRPRKVLSYPAEMVINFGCWLAKVSNGVNAAIRKDVYQKIGGLNEKINFNWENDLSVRARKEGKVFFLWHNPVITSSRHFKGVEGIRYCLKGIINGIYLILFKKTIFYNFGDVRD